MPATANATLLANLYDPEVLADDIEKKLIDGIRFSPLARIDNTLVGRDGDEITLPSYKYIGDAEDVAEGADIPIAKMETSSRKVKVAKIGKAVEISDEAILSGYKNNVADEAVKQIVTSVSSKVEGKLIDEMGASAVLKSDVALADDGASGVATALQQFKEDIDGSKVLVVPPTYYGRLLNAKGWIPNTEIGADIIIRGTVGMVYGCQIVLANRLEALKKAYILKPGALAIYMKRDTLVEFDRDILSEMNYIKASKIFAPYVYDPNKLIELTLKDA